MVDQTLLSSGDTVVCGLSGGADSIALTYALKQLETTLNIKVFACHLNHKTRGDESLRDLTFSKNFCNKHNIPFYYEEIDIQATLDKSIGFEAYARQIRYDFFARAQSYFNANKIATAHNANDNLETIIFNLSRGTGLSGLCGIPKTRGNIIRPILSSTREDIEQYILAQNLEFIVDSSNLTDDYTRNKIRHNILPILAEINSKSVENALKTSETLRFDEDFLQLQANDFFNHYVSFSNNEYIINCNDFLKLHSAISFRVLKKLFLKFNLKITFGKFNKFVSICNSNNPSAKLDLFKDVAIFRIYDKIVVREILNTKDILQFDVSSDFITICTNKFYNLNIAYFASRDLIDFNTLHVRYRFNDDVFYIKNGSKRVKKLLIDNKVPQHIRDFLPILCDKNGIIAICNIGTSYDRINHNSKNLKIIFRSI